MFIILLDDGAGNLRQAAMASLNSVLASALRCSFGVVLV